MTVYLVGAGPGDPELVTRRCAELLATADVVVHDRLVDRRVLALSAADAELINVGKRAGAAEMTQDEINALLVARGRSAARVVRLKGGDPYVFGRGGEEASVLAAAGVAYEVVPGVSALIAGPEAAGVPLTMRGLSSAVVLVTGHDPADEESGIEWDALARSGATLVVAMGGATRDALATRLIAAGMAPDTPVAVVESATLPEQRSVRSTLAGLGSIEVASPATIVVGAVAALDLMGYEDRPMSGWRVVVTRAEDQSDGFVRALGELGAIAVTFPTIAIADASDGGAALEKAAGEVSSYEWIAFSSENAVERFFTAIRDARALGAARVAAIGSATATALERHGVHADLVPLRFVDEALLESFPPPAGSARVLLPRASEARAVLPEGLRALGYEVEIVEAYRTVRGGDVSRLGDLDGTDVVTFLSSSAVEGFVASVPPDKMPPVVASIGPVTSATARELGLEVAVEAGEHTVDGLVTALVTYATGRASARPGLERG